MEDVTIVEVPSTVVVDIMGYEETTQGLCMFKTIFAEHIHDELKGTSIRTGISLRRPSTKYCKWQDDDWQAAAREGPQQH